MAKSEARYRRCKADPECISACASETGHPGAPARAEGRGVTFKHVLAALMILKLAAAV